MVLSTSGDQLRTSPHRRRPRYCRFSEGDEARTTCGDTAQSAIQARRVDISSVGVVRPRNRITLQSEARRVDTSIPNDGRSHSISCSCKSQGLVLKQLADMLRHLSRHQPTLANHSADPEVADVCSPPFLNRNDVSTLRAEVAGNTQRQMPSTQCASVWLHQDQTRTIGPSIGSALCHNSSKRPSVHAGSCSTETTSFLPRRPFLQI